MDYIDRVTPPNDQLDWDWLNTERPKMIAAESGPKLLGLPERWIDHPLWRCPNGHVSQYYIKSEQFGCDLCPACRASVRLTSPEDRDDPDATEHKADS